MESRNLAWMFFLQYTDDHKCINARTILKLYANWLSWSCCSWSDLDEEEHVKLYVSVATSSSGESVVDVSRYCTVWVSCNCQSTVSLFHSIRIFASVATLKCIRSHIKNIVESCKWIIIILVRPESMRG